MPADTTALQKKWDQHFAEQPAASADQACEVLRDNAHLLPSSGLALDLACGLGANALFLARAGLSVHAWDISDTALTTLSMAARQQGLDVMSQRFDIEHGDWPDQRFDVICVSRFLNRALCPRLLQQLRPGGLLFYQTFSAENRPGWAPATPISFSSQANCCPCFQRCRCATTVKTAGQGR